MGGRILMLVVFSLLIMVAGVTAVSAGNANYKTHLTGRNEVPRAIPTRRGRRPSN